MKISVETVLNSLETTMDPNWASSFRPYGAYVEEVRFMIYNSTEIPQAMLALRNGELDAYDEHIPQDYLATLVQDPDIEVSLLDYLFIPL
jgi:ABC-type transport system substrate-binding protein